MATSERSGTRRPALGRGLSALIPSGDDRSGDGNGSGTGLRQLPIDRVVPGSYQPRTHFDPRSLDELAASIRKYGILQPLVVRPQADHFELVAGERRLRAARIAGLTEVPAVVRELDDEDHLQIALIENVQRADLNAIEEARGYLQLMDAFGLSQQDVAARIGKSRPYIANKIRLLQLPEELQLRLVQGELSEGHVRALLSFGDRAEMLAAAESIVREGLSVRDTEALSRRKRESRASTGLDADWEALRRDMETALGTPVKLQRTARGGSLTIRFFADDQLDALVRRLLPHN